MRMTYEQHSWDGEMEGCFGRFFYALDEKYARPDEFTEQDAIQVAAKIGIVESSARRYMTRLFDYGLVEY